MIYHDLETDAETVIERAIIVNSMSVWPIGLPQSLYHYCQDHVADVIEIEIIVKRPALSGLIDSVITKELNLLNNLRILRQVCSFLQRIEIHDFSDASETAYGACVYVRSANETELTLVTLLCAKSKIVSLKPFTILKLELSAAYLLMKLVAKVRAALDVNINSVYYWSDSTIVLNWIEVHRLLQTFVRNRVINIQAQSPIDNWKHTPFSDNPTDLLFRGIPTALIGLKLWWHGPTWLAEPEKQAHTR